MKTLYFRLDHCFPQNILFYKYEIYICVEMLIDTIDNTEISGSGRLY